MTRSHAVTVYEVIPSYASLSMSTKERGNKRPESKMVSCNMKYKLVGTASCDTLPLYDPTLGVSTEFVGGL
jgi:hypothetical protein